MKRVSFKVIALLSAIVVTTAGAQTYGTTVDEAWYDMVAEVYQNPPQERGEVYWSPTWPYKDAYPAVVVQPVVAGNGAVSFRSADSGDCELFGAAAIAEDLMRSWVLDLNNLIEGPGAEVFRLFFQELVGADIIAVRTKGPQAVALADGVRYPPMTDWPLIFELVPGEIRLSGAHFFSIAQLQEYGAIEGDTVTIVHGLGAQDRCVFDLTQLP